MPTSRVPPTEVRVRPMLASDAGVVLAIYQAGLDTGEASFETTAPTWESFDRTRCQDHRCVAVDERGTVLGWVAVTPYSARAVYAGVVESSVYVKPDAQRGGVGRALMAALVDSTEAAGVWTIQAGVFPENRPSLALHSAAGFRVVGRRERIGCQHGRWRDVLLLERRSQVV